MAGSRRSLCAVALVALAATLGPTSGSAGAAARADAEDADVVGVVVAADGTPQADVEVVVVATNTGSGFCFLCFDDTVADTDTNDAGEYTAVLPDSYVAGTETDTDWIVHAILPDRDGQVENARSTMEFEVNIAVQEAPPLPVWAVDPLVSIDGWTVHVDASTAAPPSLTSRSVRLGAEHDTLVAEGDTAAFDARLLEIPAGADPELRVAAYADEDVRVPHANGRTIYHQRTHSTEYPVDLWPVPPSRGASCSATLADGTAVDVDAGYGCLLTDGSFNITLSGLQRDRAREAAGADGSGDTSTTIPEPPPVAEVTLELAAPIDLAMVVLGTAAPGATVEASADAVTWIPLGGGVGPDDPFDAPPKVVHTPEAITPTRYLRLRAPGGVDASEVSLWEAAPGTPPLAGATGILPSGDIPDFGPGHPGFRRSEPVDGWRLGVAALAQAGVLGGWLALGYVVIPGRTDRRRVAASPAARPVRWVRSRIARVACAVGAWPHVLDLVHRVDDHEPALTPSTEEARFTCGRLHRYGTGEDATKGPVLIVHSVISSSSVLDLTPHVSLVQALLESGRDVWLLDWSFRLAPADTGLDALAAEVDVAAWRVRQATGATQVPIVAYCLGATLALLREASHPAGDPLVLVAPVVDTTADLQSGTGMGMVLAHPWLHPTLALDERGFVPGSLVREAFHWLRPKALRTVRSWGAAKATPELAAGYAAMARWVWDHQDLPGGVLFDTVSLFRRGGLPTRARLDQVRVPVLVVCAQRDHIVPPASSLSLSGLVAGPVDVVEIEAGHVGMLVSLGSGDVLRPALLGWLDLHTAASP